MVKRSIIVSLPVLFAIGFLFLWITLLWPTKAAQADIPTILIDDFSTNQTTLSLTFPPAGTAVGSAVNGSGILGGERDLTLNLISGVIAGNTASEGVSSGFYAYSQDATIAASGSIIWDGVDGDAATLNPTGLGGLDLTSGNQQNAFLLDFVFDDLPLDLIIEVYTDGANASTATINLSGLIFSSTPIIVPYSSFSVSLGTGADFTNIGAIIMTVSSTTTAPDVVINSIRTTNTVNAILTDALFIDDGNGLVDPGDTIRYTAVVQNPDDTTNAAETGVTFSAIPDANTTLITSSVTTTQGTVTTGNTGGDTDVAIDIGTIADGASTMITFDVVVNDPFPQAVTELSIQGLVNSDALTNLPTDDPDDPTGNDDATVTVINPPPPPLQISKTADPEPAVAGTAMTYTMLMTNTTMVTITNIILSDTLPASTTLSFVDHIDDDNSLLGFGGGTGENVVWIDPRPDIDTDNERLTISDTLSFNGVFTSRVMDANSTLPWETLSWVPRRPYGKALPNNGATETAYDVGNINMLANSVLLHFDAGTTVFSNTSGIGQNAVCPAVVGESCPTIDSGGIYSRSVLFNGIDNTLDISETSNPSRYAIELWLFPTSADNTSFIFQTDSYSTTVLTYSQMIGINDGYFVHSTLDDSGQLKTVTSTTPALPFEIYHLVGIAEGNGDLKLFVNGVEEARRSDLGTLWAEGTHYRIGSAYRVSGTSYYSGYMDELAIYNRTLSAAEIVDRFVRGSTFLEFQVRSCDDVACDTEEFVGPDGTPSTYFSEAQNNNLGLPTAVLSGIVADNRYFQYQANFFTANPAVAPELQEVVVAPGHPAIESSQGSCTAAIGAFSCAIGELGPSEVATVTLQVNIYPSALGVITNTVFVTSTEGFSGTAAVTSTIVSEADLQLVKNDVEDPVSIGAPQTYTIDVINAGPSTVLSATVTDTLPSNMIGTAAGLGWDCTGGNTITCTIPSLLPGTYLEAIVITTTSPITEGVITNTAGITSSLTPETVITNNVTYQDTTVVRLADLAITKEDSPDPVLPGETVTYTITVQNNGPYTATSVIITDTLPSGLTANPVSAAGWICNPQVGNEFVCGFGTALAPTEVASFTITATAPISGFLINTAVVSSNILDPDLENNETAAFTAIERVSDLSISKTDLVDPVFAGETITYTVVVTNDGPLPAGVLTTTLERRNGGNINVPILAGEASRYPSSIFIDSVPGLVRNITVTLENVSHTFPQDLSILLVGPAGQNVVLMSEAAGGQDADNVTLTFNDSGVPLPVSSLLTNTIIYRPSNYGLTTPFPAPAPAGPYGGSLSAFNNSSPNGQWRLYVIDTVDSDGGVIDGWRLEITAATTDTVTVAEFLPTTSTPLMPSAPAGWQFNVLSTHNWEYVTNQLAVGQSVSFTIEVTAPITPGVIMNTAVITSTGLDLITDNNMAIITTTVLPLIDLVITKTADALTVPIGYPVVYTLTVGNNGPSPIAEPITLTDSLPPELTSVTVITNGWICETSNLPELSCTLDSLGVGLAPEVVIMAQVPSAKGLLINTAVVTSTLAETDTSNNESAVTITISDIPIQGLVATNSSPHVIGIETLLQASIITGTNVSYEWDLGDGTIISGNPISHTYAITGAITAVVTASNDVSVVTATTVVMIDEFYTLYLPVVGNQFVDAPDLEVVSLSVSSNNVTIVIVNNGLEDVVDEFWVDFYVNPSVIPVGPNDTWENSGGSGAVWGVEGVAIPIAAGEMLTLTLNDAYYRPEFSNLTFPITAGSQTYGHVDSANANTNSGAVLERHEILGLPYNNIIGPVSSTADVRPSTAAPTDRPPLSAKLPPRPH